MLSDAVGMMPDATREILDGARDMALTTGAMPVSAREMPVTIGAMLYDPGFGLMRPMII